MRMYRFSVAWPRIQPTGSGPVNEAGLDFYRRLVDELLDAGITPNLSLYHWDLPQALQDAGGWPARETALRFADYASIVYEALHDRVAWWGTINEPWCVALLGHAAGYHAPGARDPVQTIRTIHHVLLASRSRDPRHARHRPAPGSASCSTLRPCGPRSSTPDPVVERGVRLIDGYRNRVWIESLFEGRYPEDLARPATERFGGFPVEDGDLTVISAPIDWLGVNYYNDSFVAARLGSDATNPGVEGVSEVSIGSQRTDSGWSITPTGLRDLLVSIGRDHPSAPPMLVTENGAAYDDPLTPDGSIDDARRIDYLEQHLLAVSDAIADGADVRGYLVWSLLDNFEWAEGYAKRFGIVHVDFADAAPDAPAQRRLVSATSSPATPSGHPRRPRVLTIAAGAGRVTDEVARPSLSIVDGRAVPPTTWASLRDARRGGVSPDTCGGTAAPAHTCPGPGYPPNQPDHPSPARSWARGRRARCWRDGRGWGMLPRCASGRP